MPVRVVTDSTADLTPELLDATGIEVVPLNVHFGEETYRDRVDLTPDAFYALLVERADVIARTSQPSPAAFAGVYGRLAAEGDSVVSVHLAEQLSGTLASARMAARMVPEADVHIVDSRMVSAALGHIVLACAEAARRGASPAEVLAVAGAVRARTGLFAAIDTLEYLQRGGRIGRAQALVGSLLNVKPVITVADGVVSPMSRVRGSRRVIPELVRLFREAVADRAADVTVLTAQHTGKVGELSEALQATGMVRELRRGRLGPVTGCHTGPGVIGLAYTIAGDTGA